MIKSFKIRNDMEMVFKKTGKEIVLSLKSKKDKLVKKLEEYDKRLEEFLKNKENVKSFLTRWAPGGRGYYDRGKLFGKDQLSSEKIEEIGKIIKKIRDIQEELNRIDLINKHVDVEEEFGIDFRNLPFYGFDNK